MPQYAATQKLLDGDLSDATPEKAIKNIEMWQESLNAPGTKEAKAIAKDLAALKKALQADEPDGAAIMSLMASLGEATTAIADEAPEATGEKLRGIGGSLSSHGEDGGKTKGGRTKGKKAA